MSIPPPSTHSHTYILITGANSGLGFAICCRLIDEFLLSRPQTHHLHLIPTVRTTAKAEDTTKRLKTHLAATLRTFDLDDGHDSDEEEDEHDHEAEEELLRYHLGRVTVTPELVDLTDLVSVRRLAGRLVGEIDGGEGATGAGKIPKLDVVIWNAGIGGWLGLHTLQGMWGMATDLVETVTRPRFKIGSLGKVCKPLIQRYPTTMGKQLGTEEQGKESMDKGMLDKEQEAYNTQSDSTSEAEPPLGEIFTANVFGHYMLGHYLSPIIALGCAPQGGRIIWVSSVEADLGAFDGHADDDIMGLKSDVVYEDMKRLVDILALTADLESTRPWVDGYFSASSTTTGNTSEDNTSSLSDPTSTIQTQTRPAKEETLQQRRHHHMYLTHPAICMTEVLPQPIYIKITTFFIFWLARLFGSIWHPIQPYKGAVSAVWVALADASTLESFEEDGNASSSSTTAPKLKDEAGDEDEKGGKRERYKYTGKGKYGSATNGWGVERVERTEVDGWGYDGTMQRVERDRLGRWRDAVDLTEERRVEFEEAGRKVWRRMEELRAQWEKRVEDVGWQ